MTGTKLPGHVVILSLKILSKKVHSIVWPYGILSLVVFRRLETIGGNQTVSTEAFCGDAEGVARVEAWARLGCAAGSRAASHPLLPPAGQMVPRFSDPL